MILPPLVFPGISVFNLRRPHVKNRLSWKLESKRGCLQPQMSKDDQAKAMLPSDEAQIYMNIYKGDALLNTKPKFCK